MKCLFVMRNFVSYLSKAIFFVSRHVLIIGDVRRLSTSFLFGVIDPSVKRFMCWEISKRSVVTNLSSWFISISSAQPPVSVGNGTSQSKKLSNGIPEIKTENILYIESGCLLIHCILDSAEIKFGAVSKIIFYLGAGEQKGEN